MNRNSVKLLHFSISRNKRIMFYRFLNFITLFPFFLNEDSSLNLLVLLKYLELAKISKYFYKNYVYFLKF